MRQKLARLFAGAGLGLLLIAPVQAQPGFGDQRGGGGDRQLRVLSEFLDLSAEQEEAWRSAHEAHRDATRALLEEQRDSGQQLHALLESANPDPTEVGDLVLAQQGLRGELRSAQEALQQELKGLLNADQVVRYEAFLAAQQLDRRGPRPHRGERGGRRGGGRR